MAAAISLGLYEPTALPYLVAESILPHDPPRSLYSWRVDTLIDSTGLDIVEEEVVITQQCVVWSRSGIVKRVYNLDVEGERVLQAFTTWFAGKAIPSAADTGHQCSNETRSDRPARKLHSEVDAQRQSINYPHDSEGFAQASRKQEIFERALVVVLKTQVHIFLLSGDSHVIPLFFEAEAAFPAPRGFLIQRRLTEDEIGGRHPSSGAENLPSPRRSSPALPLPLLQCLLRPGRHRSSLPRFFSFSEVLCEVGLVVIRPPKQNRTRAPGDEELSLLSSEEEIIYVSSKDELSEGPGHSEYPFCVAVTQNTHANTVTIWHGTYMSSGEEERPLKRPGPEVSGNMMRRKSSNVFDRAPGAATPTSRTVQARASFGGLAQSFSEHMPHRSADEPGASPTTDLESQLGLDFGEVGVQTRSARRVSSMLARTDLSTGPGHDRTTFNDLSASQGGRKSTKRNAQRGESTGSFGTRRRSSFAANGSTMSNGTSYLEVPSARFLDVMSAQDDPQENGNNQLHDSVSSLPHQVMFKQIKILPQNQIRRPLDPQAAETPKVFSLLTPRNPEPEQEDSREMSIWIMDKSSRDLSIISLKVQKRLNSRQTSQSPHASAFTFHVRPIELRRGSNIVDACKVEAGIDSRVLILTDTRDHGSTLHLEAPWSFPFRIDLPANFMVFNPLDVSATGSPDRHKEMGKNRVIPLSEVKIVGLESAGALGQVLARDRDHRSHRIYLQFAPQDPTVRQMLAVCRFVLPGSRDDGLLIAWWEVMRWLKMRDSYNVSEATAFVVVLFAMALPFTTGRQQSSSLNQTQKKGGSLRSSSGTAINMTSWDRMLIEEESSVGDEWITTPSWNLATPGKPNLGAGPELKSPRSRPHSSVQEGLNRKDPFLSDCLVYAREFLQTPSGETAIGSEGYLPTAMSKDRELRRTSIAAILIGLHLYREEQKLHVFSSRAKDDSVQDIGLALAQLGQWLGWRGWTWHESTYYSADIAEIDRCAFEETEITAMQMPAQPFDPPSIFGHLEQRILQTTSTAFPTLLDVAGNTESKSKSAELRSIATGLTPRLFMIDELFSQINENRSSSWPVERLLACGLDRNMSETLPDGIGTALKKEITMKRTNLPSNSSRILLNFVDHQTGLDSALQAQSCSIKISLASSHEAVRDYHSIGNNAFDADNLHSWDASSEADRQTVTRLIFREDRRFQEASRLVNQTRPPIVECRPEPEWSEADLLEAQKELVHFVARRTLSVASGRGMMHFNARVPLPTERVPIPAFSLQCVMKPRNDGEGTATMTFSAEKAAFTEDKVCWAFFHNGASAGLMISKDSKGIDTSWILYNKPQELTNRHAGFLLALGLTGHLKNLAKWVAFKYLTPKHTMTSIGLLLGLSASYLGTMDTLITRLLSIHVTRLLPPGAAELNLSPLTQATSIMGIGLLYYGSQHRRMSEIMLSEIENNDPEEGAAEDAILRDEGYRLAAGFSLGFINLGYGKRLHGLHDMGVVERLLAVAIGTKNVNLVHVLDRATAGATVALALIFMKTNDEFVAQKIDIPDTTHQFDYVRPDIFLLRTLARHLIMWDKIEATWAFMEASLPKAYQHRSSLRNTKHLSTEDMPFFNIVAGICLAMGLRFAGSGDIVVRELLVQYLDQFIRLTRLTALNYDAKLTRNSVRNCQDVVALATSAVMAGTGDLVVLRRLRSLHGRTDADTPYGSHLAAHMAIGALFLGGGTYTFGTSNLAVASLLCAFYPLFPTSVLDNKSHLQAFRHLWALAAEPRCITARDAGTQRPVTAELEVTLRNGSMKLIRAPTLLPELSEIMSIKSRAPEYWDEVLDFSNTDNVKRFKRNQSIFLRRRAAYEASASDLFVSELQTLAEAGPAPSMNANANTPGSSVWRSGAAKNPFEWLFALEPLQNFDVSERALVLPGHGLALVPTGNGRRMLRGTVVDTTLELGKGIVRDGGARSARYPSRDQLWQLRLLFAWSDRWEREERQQSPRATQEQDVSTGEGWLRQEAIDRLRWRIWKMAER